MPLVVRWTARSESHRSRDAATLLALPADGGGALERLAPQVDHRDGLAVHRPVHGRRDGLELERHGAGLRDVLREAVRDRRVAPGQLAPTHPLLREMHLALLERVAVAGEREPGESHVGGVGQRHVHRCLVEAAVRHGDAAVGQRLLVGGGVGALQRDLACHFAVDQQVDDEVGGHHHAALHDGDEGVAAGVALAGHRYGSLQLGSL